MTDKNLKIWTENEETNPAHTKEVTFGRGFTAIDPYQQVKNATAYFGPAGEGWGWSVSQVQFPPNDTVAVCVRLWHGSKENYIEQWGQNGIFIDNKKTKDDQDCMKKATTDGLTKCLSFLGFNADIFLGKFDDNKYVNEMREKANKEEKAAESEAKKDEDLKWCNAFIASLELCTTAEQVENVANENKAMFQVVYKRSEKLGKDAKVKLDTTRSKFHDENPSE